MCEIYTWRKAKHIHKRQTDLLKDYYHKGSVEKISSREFQGAWRQDKLIGDKPPVIK
jgi:hypothetical protein